MKFAEDIRPITYLKTHSAELVRNVVKSRRPMVITQSGKARAVVLDVATYESLRDAALVLKLMSRGEKDVEEGRTLPQKEAFRRIQNKLLQSS